MSDLGTSDITDRAEDPKRATVDGNTVEQHALKDQIDAALFVAAKAATAAGKSKKGLVLNRFKATGGQQ